MAGAFPALLAAVGFAVFQTVNRRALSGVDVYRGTAALLSVGTVALATLALATQDLSLLARASVSSVLVFAAAGFVHFFCGWTFLGLSQLRLGAARTGIVIGTVPLFGALLAALLLAEPLTARTAVGLTIVVAGVAVISTRGGAAAVSAADVRWGVAAGLATAVCWSASPVLIRIGLQGLPSPLIGATIGMAASAFVYALGVLATRRRVRRAAIPSATWGLLLAAGIAVSTGIWMQWTAFDLAPIASVLALLQLTPVLVVLLAVRIGGDELTPAARRRTWAGTLLTVIGSLILVLTD